MAHNETIVHYDGEQFLCQRMQLTCVDVLEGDFIFDQWTGVSLIPCLPVIRGRICELHDAEERAHLYNVRTLVHVLRVMDEVDKKDELEITEELAEKLVRDIFDKAGEDE